MRRLLFVVLLCLTGNSLAFQAGARRETLDRFLFAPDLIMRNQLALDLTKEQREFIVNQIQEAQNVFTAAKWELQSSMDELSDMIRNQESEEADIVAKLDEVLDLERKIKRAQLLLAYRIHRTLTPEQRVKLRSLRPGGPPPEDPGGFGPPRPPRERP